MHQRYGPAFDAIAVPLKRICDSITAVDLQYKNMGVQYHCVSMEVRERLENEYPVSRCQQLEVEPDGTASDLVMYMRRSAQLARNLNKEIEQGVAELDARKPTLEQKLKDLEELNANIIERVAELVPFLDWLQAQQRDIDASTGSDAPAVTGSERASQMSPRQLVKLAMWALETREVMTAIKLGKLAEDNVIEFILDDSGRFIIEEA